MLYGGEYFSEPLNGYNEPENSNQFFLFGHLNPMKQHSEYIKDDYFIELDYFAH